MSAEPQLIPVPENFPVRWESPEDAEQFWTVDLMHWPHGASPLTITMDAPPFMRGLNKVAEDLCMPFRRLDYKPFNGYLYNTAVPFSTDPAVMAERQKQMEAKMMQHVPGLLDRWYKQYEPEVRSINDETLNGDYSKLGDRDLSGLLEALTQKREREGELHFLAVFPAMGAVMLFDQVYRELFSEPRADEHFELLQGFPNKSMEANAAIWRLSQEARKLPKVLDIINGQPAHSVHSSLPQINGGAGFQAQVHEYLREYGWRAAELDIAEVTWFEDATPVYKLVKEYASQEGYDPDAEFRDQVAARQAREKDLIAKAADRGEMFRQVLGFAQQYLPIQEDHNFWIDQVGLCVERVPVLEAGRRLVEAGRIRQRDDIFFLEYAELQDALRGGRGDLTELVGRRRAEREFFRNNAPPPALGTMPPPDAPPDPMITKFFGGPPEESADKRLIHGNAASRGQVTGTARVILSLDEAQRLKSGEILVCPATMPPWTPLFGLAKAVVTDHGGVLSHTAIVAREYRIPAVVGTKIATTTVRDGQTITVDGAAGTVRLED